MSNLVAQTLVDTPFEAYLVANRPNNSKGNFRFVSRAYGEQHRIFKVDKIARAKSLVSNQLPAMHGQSRDPTQGE